MPPTRLVRTKLHNLALIILVRKLMEIPMTLPRIPRPAGSMISIHLSFFYVVFCISPVPGRVQRGVDHERHRLPGSKGQPFPSAFPTVSGNLNRDPGDIGQSL